MMIRLRQVASLETFFRTVCTSHRSSSKSEDNYIKLSGQVQYVYVRMHKAKLRCRRVAARIISSEKSTPTPDSGLSAAIGIPAPATEFEDRLSRCNEELVNLCQPPMVITSPTSPCLEFASDRVPVKHASLLIFDLRCIYRTVEGNCCFRCAQIRLFVRLCLKNFNHNCPIFNGLEAAESACGRLKVLYRSRDTVGCDR